MAVLMQWYEWSRFESYIKIIVDALLVDIVQEVKDIHERLKRAFDKHIHSQRHMSCAENAKCDWCRHLFGKGQFFLPSFAAALCVICLRNKNWIPSTRRKSKWFDGIMDSVHVSLCNTGNNPYSMGPLLKSICDIITFETMPDETYPKKAAIKSPVNSFKINETYIEYDGESIFITKRTRCSVTYQWRGKLFRRPIKILFRGPGKIYRDECINLPESRFCVPCKSQTYYDTDNKNHPEKVFLNKTLQIQEI